MFYAWDQSWKVILCMVGIAGICHHTLFFLIVVFFFSPDWLSTMILQFLLLAELGL
jgi:hypothetical protein